LPARAVSRLADELAAAAGAPVALERPSSPEHGDYATNVALQLAPARKRSPRELAEELTESARGLDAVERAEVAGPGFVNLWLAPAWYGDALAEILDAAESYGGGFADPRERVQVEMVSANPTGPVTVASARNAAYGDSVARLLEHAGHEVEREYYVNDSGSQTQLFRASVGARRSGEELPEGGYQGAYIEELAHEDGDPVPRMLEQIDATLERFRIHFDTWRRQTELEGRLPELIERLETYETDGAVWVRSSQFGDDKDRVIVRSQERGGLPTYAAVDIVYLADKLERGFDRVIYVLGADHHGVRGWYPIVAKMLGYDGERVEVLIYQLVHLTEGGRQKKVSKRRGDVVFLDEFMDEVGVDAARWYLVSRGPDQPIDVDVDLAAEKTQKNPVYYVQYAHARTAGVLRNAGAATVGSEVPADLSSEERDLIKRLAEFPEVVAEAVERRGPQAIPTYAIRVADDFHRFYHEHRVLGSEFEAFRLGLVKATQTVIARSLQLIGVEAPERM
jgi:arginyl-tRNA synthetase